MGYGIVARTLIPAFLLLFGLLERIEDPPVPPGVERYLAARALCSTVICL